MAYRTIKAVGGRTIEDKVVAAFSPGMLLEQAATGLQKHSTAGGSAERIFAMESEEQGEDVDDAYVAGEQCKALVCSAGDEVIALLYDGETAVIGSKLESQGNGYLRVVDTDTSAGTIGVQSIVGTALEALDMSDSSGADPASQRIRIRVW